VPCCKILTTPAVPCGLLCILITSRNTFSCTFPPRCPCAHRWIGPTRPGWLCQCMRPGTTPMRVTSRRLSACGSPMSH
jgi:hypothetical protein